MVDHSSIEVLNIEGPQAAEGSHAAGVFKTFGEQRRRNESLYADWGGQLRLLIEQLDRLQGDQLRTTEQLLCQALECELTSAPVLPHVSPLTSQLATGSRLLSPRAASASSGENRWSRQAEHEAAKPTGSAYEGAVGALIPGRSSPLPRISNNAVSHSVTNLGAQHSSLANLVPGTTGAAMQAIETVFAGSTVWNRIAVETTGVTGFGSDEVGNADDGAGCPEREDPVPTVVSAWEATTPAETVPRTTTSEVIGDAIKMLTDDDDNQEEHNDRLRMRTSLQSYTSGFGIGASQGHSKPLFPLLARVVYSTKYQMFCSLVIICNAIFVGMSAQYSLDSSISVLNGGGRDKAWESLEESLDFAFCIWFALELGLNFVAHPWRFVSGDIWRWNLFDTVLVLNYVVELVLESASVNILNVGDYLRTLRIFRTARVLRIIRVFRVFASLRLMVVAIVQSLTSLLWVFLLLVLLMYVFAIFFLNAAEDYVHRPAPAAWAVTGLQEHYGSVIVCLWSLFKAISGGVDWQDLVVILMEVDQVYGCIFTAYIFFVVFGVLNVVTGAFVDNFALVSQRDRDTVIEEELRREHKYIDDMQHMFEGADTDKSGMLTMEEFEQHLKDPRVKAFFTTLELDVSQARALFTLLDTDGTDEVGIDEFVQGCMRLKGEAKSIDVNMLLYQNEYIMFKINSFADQVNALQALAEGASVNPSSRHSTLPTGAAREDEAGDAGSDGSPSRVGSPLKKGQRLPSTSPEASSPSRRGLEKKAKTFSDHEGSDSLPLAESRQNGDSSRSNPFARAAHTTAMVHRLGSTRA